MDDVELLSEALMRAFAEGNVRLKRSIEANFRPEQTVNRKYVKRFKGESYGFGNTAASRHTAI